MAMGYRNMDNAVGGGTYYGKPVGFGIVIGRICKTNGTMTFESLFRDAKGEIRCWSKSVAKFTCTDKEEEKEKNLKNEEVFDEYIKKIAHAEHECKSGRVVEMVSGDNAPFAFVTKIDYLQMINL